jgi:hypothetical protein
VVPITLKERLVYLVQYEKLLEFCFHCGMIGHEVTQCGDGVYSKYRYEWGIGCASLSGPWWLGEKISKVGGGRGCGRGDVEEMETSHDGEEDVDMVAKKREAPETEGGGRVAQQLNLLENSVVPSTRASPVKEQEKKRARKNGGGDDDTNSSMNRSALSFEESDRAQ